MNTIELVLIAIGLAADAFGASISKGLNMTKVNYKHAFIIAVFFGGFQTLMPLLGWMLGTSFATYITAVDHWVAFALLSLIGGNMIYEAFQVKSENDKHDDKFDLKDVLLMAIATSIDALAVGVTFAIMPNINITFSVATIGIITFAISFGGVIIGNKFGAKYEKQSEAAGGVILVLIGLHILLNHLGIISF